MVRSLRVILVCVCLALTSTFALAAVPVVVYPNPIQFGVVPVNTAGSPLFVYLTNTNTTPVTITSVTITGTNSGSFALDGYSCVGTISANQNCWMYMTFNPTVTAKATANLVIAQSGFTTPITIPLLGTGGNPVPTITSVSPAAVYINSPTTTVTLNGSGFMASSLAYLQNNTPLATTFVSSTQIKVQVPDTALSAINQVSFYVVNPQPGGGNGFASLQVIEPEPLISSVSPVDIVAGTASEPILLNGQNFAPGAKVQWNGVSMPTTYVSSNQLQIQPTTTQLASAGIIQLSVSNPSPGTISPEFSFNVTYPTNLTVLDLPANDLVWDPFAQVIYASLPSSDGANGNSIAVINPTTGTVTGYYYAGSEPTKLAIDSTSKYLYVGLNGNGSIQRLDLPAFTPDIDINLGISSGAPNTAAAIAVSPTNSQTIAVATTPTNCCYQYALYFFTGASRLANSVTTQAMDQLAFASGTTLYGYDPDVLSQVTVSATGGTLTQTWSGIVNGNTFQYSGGLILSSDGQEFNPTTGLLLGTFDVGGNNYCCSGPQVLSNSTLNRMFALGQTPFFSGFGITSYSLSQFTPVGVADLSGLNYAYNPPTISKFIQWGSSGLAFILGPNCCSNSPPQVVVLQSPTLLLAASRLASPLPALTSASPTAVSHGTGNFRLTLHGSGFLPGSVVTWNSKAVPASYVNGNEITVYVTKSTIATAGTADIVVKNPAPGGGKSTALAFTVK